MKTTPNSSEPLRSKVSILFVVLAILTPLMICVAAAFLALVFRENGFQEISVSLAVHLLWIFPLSILLRRGKTLILEMRNGEPLKIHGNYYRNYRELEKALTAGIESSPALKAKMDKEEARHFLLWLGLLFVTSLLFLLYIQIRLDSLPLEARKLERLQVVLAEKPILLWEEENGDTISTRLTLRTKEYPGVGFQIKGAALQATPANDLAVQLKPDDGLTLLANRMDYNYAIVQKDHSLIRLKTVDIYAISSGEEALLTLEAFNAGLRAHLEYLRRQSLLALAMVGVFLGWRWWRDGQ